MNAQQPLFEDIPADSAITAIEPLPSDPNYRRIRVNGRIAARLRASDVERLQLSVGMRWTKALAMRVSEAIAAAKARRAAMTMLGKRAMSCGELVERLTRRGHAPTIAERIADDLAADHWLDDERYARDVAEMLVRERGAAKPLIVERLVRRKIDPERAERIARDVAGTDQVNAAVELAAKRFRTMRSLAPPVAARRLAGALERRGYDDEVIRAALARIGFDVEGGGA